MAFLKVKHRYGETMQNRFRNLQKIEFVLTYACTGKCKHCSQGAHEKYGDCLDADVANRCIVSLCENYDIKTALVFGGEPLIFAKEVCKIIACARDCEIDKRQVITNGYFTKDKEKVKSVAKSLAECGVNDLLLSADAFHQEYIPIEAVEFFAKQLKSFGVPTRIQPAWLVSKDDDNPYNQKTRAIIDKLCKIGFDLSDGNVVFFEGNAKKYLAEYFEKTKPQNPYIENPDDIRCISVDRDGNALSGNIYKNDITDIIKAR